MRKPKREEHARARALDQWIKNESNKINPRNVKCRYRNATTIHPPMSDLPERDLTNMCSHSPIPELTTLDPSKSNSFDVVQRDGAVSSLVLQPEQYTPTLHSHCNDKIHNKTLLLLATSVTIEQFSLEQPTSRKHSGASWIKLIFK